MTRISWASFSGGGEGDASGAIAYLGGILLLSSQGRVGRYNHAAEQQRRLKTTTRGKLFKYPVMLSAFDPAEMTGYPWTRRPPRLWCLASTHVQCSTLVHIPFRPDRPRTHAAEERFTDKGKLMTSSTDVECAVGEMWYTTGHDAINTSQLDFHPSCH